MKYTFNFRDIWSQWKLIAQGNTMSDDLDKLHRKWLGAPMMPLPTL